MSPESRLERIRPCLTCGGLIPFSAVECHLCGAATEGAPREGERVRACLNCGVIVRYDQDPCPECGAPARLPRPEADGRLKECVQCGEVIPFQDLYCRACGEFSIELEEDDIAPQIELKQPLTPAERALEWVAAAAFLAGLSALSFAGLRILV